MPRPLMESVGDAHDNALALGRDTIGLFKPELITRHGTWRGVDVI
jgi:hypothetical protein